MSFFAKRQTAAGSSTAAAAAAAAAQKPWIEKYRPKTMDDISSQEQAVAVLKKTMESQNLPHLLFYGPPGTGKTSTILALARDIYGYTVMTRKCLISLAKPEMIGSRVLELNASDERGIQVIREKVKNFARSTVTHNIGNQNCPPYKIIILDEADSMTSDAQSALRRTMETYSKLTRFCLICNYVTRIIEPLASRCAKFRFRPLEEKHSKERLELICQQESVKISPEAILSLIRVSEGDLRKAIMHLQSASRLVGKDAEIDLAMIADIAG
ncbi:replication factor C subunit 4, partial [Mortierella sp. AD010]